MAAPFLLALLLIASAGTAAGDEELSHLELRGTLDSGAAPKQGLMSIMSMIGCGRFAGLLAATPNASEVFQERIIGGGGGLTVFCPDDKAVAAFDPTFRTLGDHDRLAVLLHHGAPARYSQAQLAPFDWVSVRTLAAADGSQTIILFADACTVWLSRRVQGGVARVIKTVSSEEGPLAVFLVDSVLLPDHLGQKLDGGFLGWLHLRIQLWAVLPWVAAAIVGVLLLGSRVQ